MSILQKGDILTDVEQGTRYRVILIHKDTIILCQMDIDKLSLMDMDKNVITGLMAQKQLSAERPTCPVLNEDALSEDIKADYLNKKAAMRELTKAYGPTYLGLMGKKSKPEAKAIMEKYNLCKSVFWVLVARYLQSGMQDISLVNQKAFGNSKGQRYEYTNKPGRPPKYLEDTGVMLTDEILGYFEEALQLFKKGRNTSIRSVYDAMNLAHFSYSTIINGEEQLTLLPASERPTYIQLYNYIVKRTTVEERDIIKTSAREHFNNKRILKSDSLYNVEGPGDMVEIDACEVDVSLVSMFDQNRTVGRPIVYFMIDVFSRIILAVSVAFDNNSNLGLTNLFLNLADNKHQYCQRYGMDFTNEDIWPSNIIPKRVRVDRGAEFRGKQFERICDELDIERILVAPATGSLKGIVEQSFRQLHLKQNVHLENHGLIERRHDSKHHTEASLNIEQYTRMVINFVLTHNQKYMEKYPTTMDMVDKKVQPIPALLWKYGVQKYGEPTPISNKEQYLYNLMTPIKASLSKRGITYRDLCYMPEDGVDPKLRSEIFRANRKRIPFEARMDMRKVGCIYYLRDTQLIQAPLNLMIHGNAELKNLTMTEYEDFLHHKRLMNAEGKVHNEELSAYNYAVNETIVKEAKKKTPSSKKNMTEARREEKQFISASNNMAQRLQKELPEPDIVEALPEPKPAIEEPKQKRERYSSFDEALEDLWDQ